MQKQEPKPWPVVSETYPCPWFWVLLSRNHGGNGIYRQENGGMGEGIYVERVLSDEMSRAVQKVIKEVFLILFYEQELW